MTSRPSTGTPPRPLCPKGRPGTLTAGRAGTRWLTTTNADGSPHVTGVGARWDDGAYWIVSGRTARKGRNPERDPRCAVSLSTKGYDVVVEGTAELVTDPDLVSAAAERYAAGGWPCEVDESGTALTSPYSAPSAGPPPWHLYRVTPTKATALQVHDPGGRRPVVRRVRGERHGSPHNEMESGSGGER